MSHELNASLNHEASMRMFTRRHLGRNGRIPNGSVHRSWLTNVLESRINSPLMLLGDSDSQISLPLRMWSCSSSEILYSPRVVGMAVLFWRKIEVTDRQVWTTVAVGTPTLVAAGGEIIPRVVRGTCLAGCSKVALRNKNWLPATASGYTNMASERES